MQELLYKEDSFQIIGCCMEVHKELGKGHNEVIYKDALEIEFERHGILFTREQPYAVTYKGVLLPHSFFSDFVVMDKIILEIKAIESLSDSHKR